MMKNKILAGIAARTVVLLSQQAASDCMMSKITIVPQLGFQMKNLDFDQSLSEGPTSGLGNDSGDFNVDMPTLTASVTAIYAKAYVSVKIENSIGDAIADSSVPFAGPEVPAEREDLSITFGYNVWKTMNVFVGYMDGETSVRPTPNCGAPDGSDIRDCNAAQLSSDAGQIYQQTYTEDGMYLGASYAWKFVDVGTLSLSIAYAELDGTYEDNYNPDFNDDKDFKYEGDSEGLSFGVNWSAPLTKHVGYYVDLRRQSYEMDGEVANANFGGSTIHTEETIIAWSAGIQWYF